MRILILDEDTDSGLISEFCEQLQNQKQSVKQISDWQNIPEAVVEFKPDALLIDLMIPYLGLPENECGRGYTTGAYIYREMLKPLLPNVPFCIFTAADTKTPRISKAIDSMKDLPEYRGTFEKGENAGVVVAALAKERVSA